MTDPQGGGDVHHRGPGPLVVIGDTLLDVDVEGEAERLCPDAPVPVVDVTAERARPGGAGLAALLAARDGADVVLITAIGDDPAGRRLCGLLSAELELVRLPLRGETVRKTRVRAGGQTLLRLDTGDGVAATRGDPGPHAHPPSAPEANRCDGNGPAEPATRRDANGSGARHPHHPAPTTHQNGNGSGAGHPDGTGPTGGEGNRRGEAEDTAVRGGGRRGAEDSTQATDEFAQGAEEYAQATDRFARGAEDSTRAADGFARGAEEYAQATDGFARGAEDSTRAADGFARGAEDCARGGDWFARGGEGFARAAEVVAAAGAVLVADYGRGVAEVARELVRGCAAPVVWDPHPRGGRPPRGCALVTPSEAEARSLCPGAFPGVDRAARAIREDLGAAAVAVTRGTRGASLALADGALLKIPAPVRASGQDVCGAGDRLASAAALALRAGAGIEEAVTAGVGAASRFVAAGGAAAVRVQEQELGDRPRTAAEVAELTRASGGRLIATGGCFDLLHAGHVSLLRRARALGDALVVCVNSDESVRRLKGPSRPIVDVTDRVEVLRALSCVDAVLVFDEGTPVRAIELLRPDVWVKGGDYEGGTLPESEVLAGIGAETVVLDLLPGRSTTNLIREIR